MKSRIKATIAVTMCATLLAGCHNQEPEPNKSQLSYAPIELLVNPQSLEQRVMAEIYKQVLENDGRDVTLIQDPTFSTDKRVENVFNGTANMWVGCTGNLLEAFDPQEARVISKDYEAAKKNPDGEDYLARTHIALMAALPPDLTTVDPSSAEGCKDDNLDLPQFYVPIYVKDLLDRKERNGIAGLTKFLDTTEVSKLVEESEKLGNPEKPVRAWVEQHIGTAGFGGGADTNDLGSED